MPTSSTTSPPHSPTVSPRPSASIRPGQPVVFTTSDGVQLKGRLFGSGPVGVVLAHGNTPGVSQAGWSSFAVTLAGAGYRVLTFDFRGFCDPDDGCSAGTMDTAIAVRDVVAAQDLLFQEGATGVVLIGASMGGVMSLYAASLPGARVAGVVAISAPRAAPVGVTETTDQVLAHIALPKLFMAGTMDEDYGSVATSMYEKSSQPKRLTLIVSRDHGADLVTSPNAKVAAEATSTILAFLAATH